MSVTMRGKRIRNVRNKLGLEPEALGDLVGATPTDVGRWESGEDYPTSFQIELLERFDMAIRNNPNLNLTLPKMVEEHTASFVLKILLEQALARV